LVAPLMGTMAIPGVFEAVAFKNMLLVDWWTINNFPVELAKEKFPKAEIIGIALNKFKENQKIRNIFDSVSRWYDLLFSGQLVSSLDLVDHLFYRQLSVSTLDTKEKDMRKIFKQWFADCLEYFAK
jgi:predicted acylesterase/phospholipase RssA